MTTKATPSENLSASIARGTAWMVFLKLVERSIGLVSTLILARLLTPGDFGLVAMAMSVVALTELMGAFGFDSALIQRQDAQRVHYDTAWTFNVIFGASIGVMLVVLAYPAAEFYLEPRLHWILPALALGALAQGLENIGTVAFRKELNFRRDFLFMLSKKLAQFSVTMFLAFYFRSYWALVGGTVTGKLVSVWVSYRLHPYRPRFTLAARADLLHFSKWLFISNLVLFLQNKTDNFVLGRMVGGHSLGIYNIANEIAVMPSTELIAPLNRAAYPAYSRLSMDLAELRRKFQEVFGMIALVGFPASVGLATVAEPAVRVLLGSQWGEAVLLLQMLTVCGLTSALQSNLIVVIVALGKPKANTLLNAGMLIAYLPAVVYCAFKYGVVGAAAVHMVLSIAVLIPLHIVFFRLTGLRFREHFATFRRPLVASVAMAGSIFALRAVFPAIHSWLPLLDLLACVALGAGVYALAVLGLWILSGRPAGAESTLSRTLLGRLRRQGSARS